MAQFSDLSLNVLNINYIDSQLEVTDKLVSFAEQIWVCFNIEKYEMISDTKSGDLSLEDLLFNRHVSSADLERVVRSEIDNSTSWSADFKYDVEVKFSHASFRDIVTIDVIIYDNHKKTLKQRFIYK